MYTLRTSPCSDNPILTSFDALLRDGLGRIANVNISDLQWIQASLPIKDGGLGIRSVSSLASSAFLASAAGTYELQSSILLRTNSCRSLQLKGIQISQSTRPFQSGRQDMTLNNQTALRPGSSERGTWQVSGPARLYSE